MNLLRLQLSLQKFLVCFSTPFPWFFQESARHRVNQQINSCTPKLEIKICILQNRPHLGLNGTSQTTADLPARHFLFSDINSRKQNSTVAVPAKRKQPNRSSKIAAVRFPSQKWKVEVPRANFSGRCFVHGKDVAQLKTGALGRLLENALYILHGKILETKLFV